MKFYSIFPKTSLIHNLNKRGIEMNFALIFGIIVGAIILVIAIYATTSLIDTEVIASETEVAKRLGILTTPLETGLEESSYALIKLPFETQIINDCKKYGSFGKQILSIKEKRGVGPSEASGEKISFFNKYIFSKHVEEGEELELIIKPLEMPYKVADMIFAFSGKYCFVDTPSDISEEIYDLNPKNIFQNDSVDNCPSESEIVCFEGGSNCDIEINPSLESVEKDGETVYYVDDFIYGAIFAEPEIYECQVERLMKRNAELAYLYAEKSNFLNGKGCSSNLGAELLSFASNLNFEEGDDSRKLVGIKNGAKNLRKRNDKLECEIF